ncbi:MAG: acyclic terpene utilization AtuA family protein [Woeseiaceae bacterium]
MQSEKTLRIGGASGYWGESAMSTPQLIKDGSVDFIVYDYLAEVTMSIMARARAANPEAGFAADFVSAVLAPNLAAIAKQGIRIVSNAGGVNPAACGAAIETLIRTLGLDLTVAVVEGDDLLARRDEFADVAEMFRETPFPHEQRVASINAYLGAFPIADALDKGADIVITGRVVDSAVTLGACIHHFGWQAEHFDQLAGGSIAGHILECGPQATGGNFTDWLSIADSMHDIGYPIANIRQDGSFDITKPNDTGGVVNVGTVAEQLLYEVGDPQAYILPDVVCDFSALTITAKSRDLVEVRGAIGHAPTDTYKVSATYADGYRAGQTLLFYGEQADRKARLFADAALRRARRRLDTQGLTDFDDTLVELIGDESHYGSFRQVQGSREVLLKVAARHQDKKAIGILLQEVIGAALAGPPSLTGFAGTRPKPSPVMRLFSFLLDKQAISATVTIAGKASPAKSALSSETPKPLRPTPPVYPDTDDIMTAVPLHQLAWGRSGDKGNKANVGIIARRAEYLPYLWNALTAEAVHDRFAHFTDQPVDKFLVPGIHAINFVLHRVLGGGGIASLRNDPQGKGYAQLLLDMMIEIPESLAELL